MPGHPALLPPAAGPPRALITTGGGSLGSPELRAETDQALERVLDVLAPLAASGKVGSAGRARRGRDHAAPADHGRSLRNPAKDERHAPQAVMPA